VLPPPYLARSKAKEQLVDWVYGATRYPTLFTEKCSHYRPWGSEAMRGLAVSMAVGTQEELMAEHKRDFRAETDVRSRNRELVAMMVRMVNPTLELVRVTRSTIRVRPQGCQQMQLTIVKIADLSNQSVSAYSTNQVITEA
jgi:hypothetical protein